MLDPVYTGPDKNLPWSAFRLHGTGGTVQVLGRQTVLQSVTEFVRLRVNGLYAHKWKKIRPFQNLYKHLQTGS